MRAGPNRSCGHFPLWGPSEKKREWQGFSPYPVARISSESRRSLGPLTAAS